MPVEEFVAGWISGETFSFFLSHHLYGWVASRGGWVVKRSCSLEEPSSQLSYEPSGNGQGGRQERSKEGLLLHPKAMLPENTEELRARELSHPKPLLPDQCEGPTAHSPLISPAVLTSPLEICPTWQWVALRGLEKGYHEPAPVMPLAALQASEAAFLWRIRLASGWLSPLGLEGHTEGLPALH